MEIKGSWVSGFGDIVQGSAYGFTTTNNWTSSPNNPTMEVLPHCSCGLWPKGGVMLGKLLRMARAGALLNPNNPDPKQNVVKA